MNSAELFCERANDQNYGKWYCDGCGTPNYFFVHGVLVDRLPLLSLTIAECSKCAQLYYRVMQHLEPLL